MKKNLLLVLLPVALGLVYLLMRPYQAELAHAHLPISQLSPQQRTNIQVAAAKLDKTVITLDRPFSFNDKVGPRTFERGFLAAPTYVGNYTQTTEGGGICLVASLLYKAGLEAGLNITERHGHSRTISSSLPGFDATVNYGHQDLKFAVPSKSASYLISCKADPYSIDLKIYGDPQVKAQLSRKFVQTGPHEIRVLTYKQDKLVSADDYKTKR